MDGRYPRKVELKVITLKIAIEIIGILWATMTR